MLTSLKSMPADNDDGNFRIMDDDDLAQGIVTAASKGSARAGGEGGNPFQQVRLSRIIFRFCFLLRLFFSIILVDSF
jgi:hypothetical protein